MPWKNGQGITQEIYVQRSESDAASGGFRFRLSIATVSATSPFSRFPHCDRTIVLLHGDGMMLDSGPGRTKRLDRPYEPYAFSGDWDTDCTLIGGPCRDFNVMVDRRHGKAIVRVLTMRAYPPALIISHPKDTLWALFALAGTVTVHAETWLHPSTPLPLAPNHSLIIRADPEQSLPRGLRARLDSADATILWVALRRREPGDG